VDGQAAQALEILEIDRVAVAKALVHQRRAGEDQLLERLGMGGQAAAYRLAGKLDRGLADVCSVPFDLVSLVPQLS